MSDDFFAELEVEISAALSKSRLKAEADAARKRVNNTRLPHQLRAEAREKLREAEALLEADLWLPVATVALFSVQECDGCGSEHRLFQQYMERQVSKTSKIMRWVRIPGPRTTLPREVMTQTTQTHICGYCAPEHDFDLSAATPLRCAPISPSPTYTQSDINEQDYSNAQN